MDFTAILYLRPQTPHGLWSPLGWRNDHVNRQQVWARRGPSTGDGRRLPRAQGRTRPPGGRGRPCRSSPSSRLRENRSRAESRWGQVSTWPWWPWPAPAQKPGLIKHFVRGRGAGHTQLGGDIHRLGRPDDRKQVAAFLPAPAEKRAVKPRSMITVSPPRGRAAAAPVTEPAQRCLPAWPFTSCKDQHSPQKAPGVTLLGAVSDCNRSVFSR